MNAAAGLAADAAAHVFEDHLVVVAGRPDIGVLDMIAGRIEPQDRLIAQTLVWPVPVRRRGDPSRNRSCWFATAL
ncbi:MAG: hypothetical protein M5U09_18080 [Gammaproteobacteria bacterium]|nr:hypothetical protein [Gammaproteobacteria bacterium]